MTKRLLVLGLIVLSTSLAAAQSTSRAEQGFPFITNYSPRQYAAGSQIWCILQDNAGIMYFCEAEGMMEFDGTEWRRIVHPNALTGRSAVLHSDGVIYAGYVGDLGYLRPNAAGVLEHASLLEYVPEKYRDFTDVWQTHSAPGGVYFVADTYLFRWDGTEMKVWEGGERGFHLGGVWNGSLYLRQRGVGLLQMESDSLVVVPGSEVFAEDALYSVLHFDETRALLATRSSGFFLFDGVNLQPLKTEADQYILDNILYVHGVGLDDGTFVFGTILGGVVQIDKQGHLVRLLDQNSGLINNVVLYTAIDSAGDVWAGTDGGISRIEIRSPYSVLDGRANLNVQAYVVDRWKGDLYIGRAGGASRLNPTTGKFEELSDLPEQIFDLLPLENELLGAGASSGVYSISPKGATLIVGGDAGPGAWVLEPATWNENIIFVGEDGGIGAIEQDERGKWQQIGRAEFVSSSTSLAQEEPGVIWIGNQTGGPYRVKYPLEDGRPVLSRATWELFGAEAGLPPRGTSVARIAGETYFVSGGGIFVFEAATQQFRPDSTFLFDTFENLGFLDETRSGDVWAYLGQKSAMAHPRGDGTYEWVRTPFARLDDSQPQWIFPEDDGVVWFTTIDGLIRYDPHGGRDTAAPITALIRKVLVGSDSVLYVGSGQAQASIPEIPFADNEVHFRFAVTNYVQAEKNLYQTRLEGFDSRWSGWQSETNRTYTNLPAGDYTFRVRAKTIAGQESKEASYSFVVIPPWYQTWWAYLIYIGGIGGLVLGFVRVRTSQLQARQRDLEQTVDERTAEVRELLSEADQRAAELGTVNEISKALVSQLEFDSLVQLVGEQVQKTFKADIAYVALLDEKRETINFPFGYGEEFPPIPFGKGLTSQIIETGEPLLINEDVTGTYEKIGREEVGAQVASYLGVPIYEGKDVVGVVSVQSLHEEGRFDENDQRLLTTIAANVGIALQNAESYAKLNKTLQDLKSTQEQLVTQEKMASLGQLTAGIAHEIKNPLNFVNNFADLVSEMARELDEELTAREGLQVRDAMSELDDILQGLKINAAQIQKHGKRADSIVKNMMQHASGGTTERYPIEINSFVDEYIGLSYHGMRAQNPNLEVNIVRDFDDKAGNVTMTPQEMGRVLVNLVNNALYAVHEKSRSAGPDYAPTVTVRTKRTGSQMEITVVDNGPGIPEGVKDKIFQPLFTTKPTGSGTGLGLSLSFEIVTHGHNGKIEVDSTEGEGAVFRVTIPV